MKRSLTIPTSLAVVALSACAGGPDVSTGPDANPSAARGLLVAAAADGPVPLEVDSVPPVFAGGVAEVARIATQGGAWLGATFVPMPYGQGSDRRRLVFRFAEGVVLFICVCWWLARRRFEFDEWSVFWFDFMIHCVLEMSFFFF